MPDISLRFHKDMLVLSSSVASAFERLGVDVRRDLEMTMLLEPETLEDVHKLEAMAGAQCVVAATATLTPARLAHAGMEGAAADLAHIALAAVRAQKPQHVLAELAPCGLPLDASSKASLRENRDQYARFARLFANEEMDAFLLNGFGTCADLKCALMGVRMASDAPTFAVVSVAADGTLAESRGRETLEEAVAVMEELGASVAGFATTAGQDDACALAGRAARATSLPLLVQLDVIRRDARQQGPTEENPYHCADSMMAAADALRREGVQFLRASRAATPAYTGALVAATIGSDVRLPAKLSSPSSASQVSSEASKQAPGFSPALGPSSLSQNASAACVAKERRLEKGLEDVIAQAKARVGAVLSEAKAGGAEIAPSSEAVEAGAREAAEACVRESSGVCESVGIRGAAEADGAASGKDGE